MSSMVWVLQKTPHLNLTLKKKNKQPTKRATSCPCSAGAGVEVQFSSTAQSSLRDAGHLLLPSLRFLNTLVLLPHPHPLSL